ncbi:MAG: hypothetical protein AVDCRST_MAG25-2585 [uncultured Rubrobacteraceae bacterium]|uniref:Uncharacterized protein n=1 Tax=uncultured Rubrobacteraceae bacterium TaxID=349277 RepID=A0A6J4RP37_9ACTN|nr:MAG: hypothetical protein AVDCRST_MAG25-2585 [uncultured Rubrobacteraceae bacterium]
MREHRRTRGLRVGSRPAAAPARPFASFLISLALGAMLFGCGSGEEGAEGAPAEPRPATAEETVKAGAPEETGAAAEESARTATVRLSGTEGTIYAGSYGNLDGSEYAEGLLEGEPVEFTVDLRESGFDVVNASFSKPGVDDDGTLKIEILAGGEVVAEQEAETQYGTLNLTWSSEG